MHDLCQVVGVEYCGRFTDAAVQIQEGRSVAYTGEDGTKCEAKLPEGAQPNKIAFKQVSSNNYTFACYVVLQIFYS